MPEVGVQVGSTAVERMASNIVSSSKARDKSGLIFDKAHFITRNYVERIWLFQKHKCHYCDKTMQVWDRKKADGCTIERLDNKFGHTHKNCVLACSHCNKSREKKNFLDFENPFLTTCAKLFRRKHY